MTTMQPLQGGVSSRAPRTAAETVSRTDTTRKDGAAHHRGGFSLYLYPPGQRCRLCTSSSTGRLEAPVTLPASSGELPRAPGEAGWLATKEQHYPHRALTYPQATPEQAVGLRAATLKLGALRLGCVAPGARERNQESDLPTRSLGRSCGDPGRTAVRRGRP